MCKGVWTKCIECRKLPKNSHVHGSKNICPHKDDSESAKKRKMEVLKALIKVQHEKNN